MPLDMANADDDDLEELLGLVRKLSELKLYNSPEMPYEDHHGEDAMQTMNTLIEQAREIMLAHADEDED